MMPKAIFAAGGDLYNMVTREMALLSDPEYLRLHPEHKGYALAGHLVYHALAELLTAGKLELGEEVTDRWLQANSVWLKGKSLRFIQKGLYALHSILGFIQRFRQHGRRVISFLLRLRGKEKQAGSPQTPLNSGENTEETTSTGEGSSFLSKPSEIQGTGEQADHSELVDRAIALPRDVKPTRENVEAAILTYGAEWVERAISDGEARPKNDPVRNWSLITITLEAWRAAGGPPEKPRPPADPMVERKAQKDRAREEAAQIEAENERVKRLWESLTDQQRAEIEAQIDRENPGFRKKFEGMFLAMCRTRAAEQLDDTRAPPRPA